MSRSILYRLFGIGKIPEHARAQIESEGVVLLEEGIGGSVTFRNFRAPGKRYGWRRNWLLGSIALTQAHFLAFGFSRPVIGVRWRDVRMQKLRCTLEKENVLLVEFDAATFNDDWSGEMEIRFSTPRARAILSIIRQHAERAPLSDD